MAATNGVLTMGALAGVVGFLFVVGCGVWLITGSCLPLLALMVGTVGAARIVAMLQGRA